MLLLILFFVFIDDACAALKGMDDSVIFRIDWRPKSSIPQPLQNVKEDTFGNHPFVFISSGNDEKYLCHVPDASSQPRRKVESYAGATPSELIEPMYEDRVCSYWIDIYWTYELCHGRYVLQYHDDKDSPRRPRTEYYLGNFRRDQSKLDDKDYDQLNPPARKVDDQDLAYYPVTYRQGDVCDVTGKPRMVTVMYVCKEDAKDQIYSVAETSSCAYEMVVLTARLCSHPSFRPLLPPENEIVCFTRNAAQSNPKPAALIALDRERSGSFEKEYGIIPPQSLSDNPPKRMPVEDEEEDEDDLDTTVIMPKKTTPKSTVAVAPEEQEEHEDHSGPGHDAEAILRENMQLLTGAQCLYGGSIGWWKYEFCYGKSVIQFHEDQTTGARTEILLGLFNEQVHKHWIDENPQKHPLKVDGKIHQVSHMYVGGDLCDEENIHRSVEVRMLCRPSKGSQSSVTLYLLEPRTCQYVLGVESPRFCDVLQQADRYGLIPLPQTTSKPSSTKQREAAP